MVWVLFLSCSLLLILFFKEILIVRFGHKKDYNKTKALYTLLPLRLRMNWLLRYPSFVTTNPNLKNGWVGDKYEALLFSNAFTVTGFFANHFRSIPVEADNSIKYLNLRDLIPICIEITQTGIHFGFKQQVWFSIIDWLTLLLPTQTLNLLITGDKHKRKSKITFQFLNNLQRNYSKFFVG